MKVCLVTGEYPPDVGGVADYTHRLGVQLLQLGHRVTVLTSKGKPPRPYRRANGEPDVLDTVDSWGVNGLPALVHAATALQPDVLHIQYQTAAYGMQAGIAMLPRWLQWRHPEIATVTTFHDLREPYLFPKAGPLRRLVTRQLLWGSRGVVATNLSDAQTLQRMIGGYPNRRQPVLEVVPIGPNVDLALASAQTMAEVRTRNAIPNEPILLGHYGFMNRSKGIDTLFQAFRALRSAGTNAYLLMVGETAGVSDPTNRGYFAEMQNLALELGIADYLRWTAYLPPDEVSHALQALDCCVLPYADGASFRRGTLLTALAHGLPVVTTTPTAPMPEVRGEGAPLPTLEQERHCLLTPPGDAAALAAAIQRVLADATLRQRMKGGATQLAHVFSWPTIARRTERQYHELLTSGHPAVATS